MKKILSLITLSVLLLGCSDNMPPKCDSADTKKVLNNIIQEHIDAPSNQLKNFVSNFNVIGHEMLNENKNSKEYTCQARVVWTYKNGKLNSEIINYFVSLDSNQKDQFFVQIN